MKQSLSALAFTGLVLTGCAESNSTEPLVTTGEQAVITQCPWLDPLDPNFYTGPTVDYARELMITHVSVVDNPCRTTWSGSCGGGGTPGAWTFGELMNRMAGTGSPQVLVAEWLHQWEIPIVVNGFAIPPRPNIRPLVIDPWLVASGCPSGAPIVGAGACLLDLKRAPFRLLAISNRTDLACAGYKGIGDGEARFVFGVIDKSGNPRRAAIIFEYKLPPQRGGTPYTVEDWQNDWHPLSSMAMGSPAYLNHLEKLLNDITAPGVWPGGPNNGTAIGQVRTNELDFGSGGPWKLRETNLQLGAGGPSAQLLLANTTSEAPHDSFNMTGPLDSWLVANAPTLATFTQPALPPAWLGGESSAALPAPSPIWRHSTPGAIAPIERHHFAFNTCNGCHLQETNTPFLHVGNRAAGTPSVLSPFLSTPVTTAGGGLPSAALSITDPAGTGATFRYNEPWRRVCEASRMLQGNKTCWSRGNGAH